LQATSDPDPLRGELPRRRGEGALPGRGRLRPAKRRALPGARRGVVVQLQRLSVRSNMKTVGSKMIVAVLALGACAFPEMGCVSVPDEGRAPVLTTHVGDWRDEVIYQVLVDRFANG